jgi:DNA repair exonuclease SbcCD ATPase subunit
MMLTGYDAALEERLKLAEQAESEMTRLQPLAGEAPQLRSEKIKLQKAAERERTKTSALNQAKQANGQAAEKQSRVPELLGTAARAINEFYSALREVEAHRQDAMHSMAIVDRVDYEIELEDGEAHEAALDRDPRGLAYALAGRHGDSRVKKLIEELAPGFNLLEGCNLDEPLYRDVANFVMDRVDKATSTPAAAKTPA